MTQPMVMVTEFNFDALPNDWESIVSAGQSVMAAHDRNRWVLGDIGGRVETTYGESTLKNYAEAINCRPSTFYDYKRVSAFYSSYERGQYPQLTWSHYRAAMKAGGLAHQWLKRAEDERMQAELFLKEIRRAFGGKSSVLLSLRVSKVKLDHGVLSFRVEDIDTAEAFVDSVQDEHPALLLKVHEVQS